MMLAAMAHFESAQQTKTCLEAFQLIPDDIEEHSADVPESTPTPPNTPTIFAAAASQSLSDDFLTGIPPPAYPIPGCVYEASGIQVSVPGITTARFLSPALGPVSEASPFLGTSYSQSTPTPAMTSIAKVPRTTTELHQESGNIVGWIPRTAEPLQISECNSQVSHTAEPTWQEPDTPHNGTAITAEEVHLIGPLPNTERPSEEVLEVLKGGFSDINRRFDRLANETGLPIERVLSCWDHDMKCWILYQRYFKHNAAEELARIDMQIPPGGTKCISTNAVIQCFSQFKEANHKGNWEDTLKTASLLENLEGTDHTTELHRRCAFWNVYGHMLNLVSVGLQFSGYSSMLTCSSLQAKTMEERYDFSIMFVALGNLINHDRSNMGMYASPLMEGVSDLQHLKTHIYLTLPWFLELFRTNRDHFLTHLKAHV